MKQVGYYMLENICEGLRGIGWKTFKNIGLTAEEIEQLVVDAKRDASNPKNRWFGPWYVHHSAMHRWSIVDSYMIGI